MRFRVLLLSLALLICFFASVFFVIYIVIYYPLGGKWHPTFPTLNSDIFNHIVMQTHFIGGIIVLMIGPFQLVTIFIPIKFMKIAHIWAGRFYLLGVVLAFVGGTLFMIENSTVGKSNMTVAFTMYGLLFLICGSFTFYHARIKEYNKHVFWAGLTFTLGLGSLIYRILYIIADYAGYDISNDGFERPLDKAFDWLFFVPEFLIAIVVMKIIEIRRRRRLYMYLETDEDTRNNLEHEVWNVNEPSDFS